MNTEYHLSLVEQAALNRALMQSVTFMDAEVPEWTDEEVARLDAVLAQYYPAGEPGEQPLA